MVSAPEGYGGRLEACRAAGGDTILIGHAGIRSAADLVQMGEDDNRMWAWILRAIGPVAMPIGFSLLFAPVNVLASDVPILGSIVSGATFLAALVATLVVGPIGIAVAWFAYRPRRGRAGPRLPAVAPAPPPGRLRAGLRRSR